MLRKWIPWWSLPLVVVLAVATVSLRLWVVRTSYEVNQTENMIRNMSQELEASKLRVAKLRSPSRLKELAKTVLGLEPVAPESIIRMNEKNSERGSRP